MNYLDVAFIGVALAMDAFAASIGEGLKMGRFKIGQGFSLALSFGFFQFFMPVVGNFLGEKVAGYVGKYGSYVAFILLLILGINMILSKEDDEDDNIKTWILKVLSLSIATSIDALVIGVTFASLGSDMRANKMLSCCLIGVITFVISLAGILIGVRFGKRYKQKAGILGGSVLILIGIKVLIEHLLS